MLTFENVFEVFSDYLKKDDDLEIVLTKHGYTILRWDSRIIGWSDSDFCATPEDMLEILMGHYETVAEFNVTAGKRDLTQVERQQIESECEKLRQQLSKL